MHGAKRARNVALILAVASIFVWCQSSAESCVQFSGTKHDAWSKCTVLSEASGTLDSGALVELGEHIGAEPSKSAAAIAQAKPILAKLRSVCSQLKTSNTSSLASKWLGAFNSTAVDEVPGDDGVRNVNGELYVPRRGELYTSKKSESRVKGCATMQGVKKGYYVDKHCEHDSDTKYIGGHQHYRNKLNTHLGEEVEDKLGSGRRRKKSSRSSKKSSRSSKKEEKEVEKGPTWTKCKKPKSAPSTKKPKKVPEGYVFQVRVGRDRRDCTSCKPGYAFRMRRHKARTGECKEYKSQAEVECIELHTNNHKAGPDVNSTLCTKIAQDYTNFQPHKLKNETAQKHFKKATGQWGLVIAQCKLRKETVCVNGNCDVKKQAVCSTVCKFKDDWEKRIKDPKWVDPKIKDPNCYPDLCEGEYGELACTAVGAMG